MERVHSRHLAVLTVRQPLSLHAHEGRLVDIQKRNFITVASQQAEQAAHLFPTMAACEAALESSYGTSSLAILDKNLFGMKQHTHPIYGTHMLPTKEFLGGEWTVVNAGFVSYPDRQACFADRMATLERLATHAGFEHYANALKAKDAVTYVTEVSAKWSTDPKRAEKVIAIYNAFLGGQ